VCLQKNLPNEAIVDRMSGDRRQAASVRMAGERAYREHNPDLIELTREPSFAGLHSDSKFRELVDRIGWRSKTARIVPT
jgi:hypothetical protein